MLLTCSSSTLNILFKINITLFYIPNTVYKRGSWKFAQNSHKFWWICLSINKGNSQATRNVVVCFLEIKNRNGKERGKNKVKLADILQEKLDVKNINK